MKFFVTCLVVFLMVGFVSAPAMAADTGCPDNGGDNGGGCGDDHGNGGGSDNGGGCGDNGGNGGGCGGGDCGDCGSGH